MTPKKKVVRLNDRRLKRHFDPALIGAGIYGYHQLTLEACDFLSSARVIFYSGYNQGLKSFLQKKYPSASLINLDSGYYTHTSFRPDMYKAMAQRVVEAALEGRNVVLAVVRISSKGTFVQRDRKTWLLHDIQGNPRRFVQESNKIGQRWAGRII